RPDPAAPVLDVLRVTAALARGESAGEISQPYLVLPRRSPPPRPARVDGPPSERAWLARLQPFPRGPLCERVFGPVGSESRSSRVGHVHLAVGVVHPALAPAITGVLRISEEQARATSAPVLEAALAEARGIPEPTLA